MNRTIFLILLIVLALSGYSLPSFSQEYNALFGGERKFTGGLVLGANMSQIDGDAYYGYNKLGVNTGGIVYWNFTPKVGFSLEILYTQKGVRGIDEAYSPYVGPYFGKYHLNMNYAEVPLVVYYYITPRYHLGIGASYAQLINSSERYDGIDTYIFPQEDYPFLKSNVDFIASASMVVWKGFMLNIRYQYSITPIRYPENVPLGLGYNYERQMNNMFALRAIYLF